MLLLPKMWLVRVRHLKLQLYLKVPVAITPATGSIQRKVRADCPWTFAPHQLHVLCRLQVVGGESSSCGQHELVFVLFLLLSSSGNLLLAHSPLFVHAALLSSHSVGENSWGLLDRVPLPFTPSLCITTRWAGGWGVAYRLISSSELDWTHCCIWKRWENGHNRLWFLDKVWWLHLSVWIKGECGGEKRPAWWHRVCVRDTCVQMCLEIHLFWWFCCERIRNYDQLSWHNRADETSVLLKVSCCATVGISTWLTEI